ncbi:MAG TPA: GNAT family N-acetyltransferase [Flavobacterium sp.]|jgi:ribosomal protein S18 acetylase RimI-like enzyme
MEKITIITSTETFSVRHPVLRAGKPIESCRFEGDDLATTTHLGLFKDNHLIGMISIFEVKSPLFNDERQFQLRGMAILEEYQKKGFGEKLVRHAEHYLKSKNASLLWFNARLIAVEFYKKLGYTIIGEAFIIENIGTHYIMFKKI